MFEFLSLFVVYLSKIFIFALFARIILSWFNPRPNALYYFLIDVTDPLLKFCKNILPPIGFIDFSPIIAFLLVDICTKIVLSLLRLIFL